MQRQAKTFFTLRTALFTPRTSHLHFTLHTSSHLKSCELFSPHLSSSHLIPSLLTCHLSKFFSTVFISSEHWSTCLISSKFRLNSSQLFRTPDSSHCQRELSCTKKSLGAESFCAQKLGTQMHLHRKAFTEYFVLQSLHTACTKHFPVLLCTTKLVQTTSQYYFVLQSLHILLPQYYFVMQSLHRESFYTQAF